MTTTTAPRTGHDLAITVNGHHAYTWRLVDSDGEIGPGLVDQIVAYVCEGGDAPSHVVLDLELRTPAGTVVDRLTTTVADWTAA